MQPIRILQLDKYIQFPIASILIPCLFTPHFQSLKENKNPNHVIFLRRSSFLCLVEDIPPWQQRWNLPAELWEGITMPLAAKKV